MAKWLKLAIPCFALLVYTFVKALPLHMEPAHACACALAGGPLDVMRIKRTNGKVKNFRTSYANETSKKNSASFEFVWIDVCVCIILARPFHVRKPTYSHNPLRSVYFVNKLSSFNFSVFCSISSAHICVTGAVSTWICVRSLPSAASITLPCKYELLLIAYKCVPSLTSLFLRKQCFQ